MILRIDKAGRIVLPKAVRDRLGLRAGSDVEMVETAGTVVLKPIHPQPALSRKDGLLVYTGELPAGFDTQRALEEDREERMSKIWGA